MSSGEGRKKGELQEGVGYEAIAQQVWRVRRSLHIYAQKLKLLPERGDGESTVFPLYPTKCRTDDNPSPDPAKH